MARRARVTAEEVAQVASEAPENAGLVPMEKDGVILWVHPTCVENHEALDWAKVEA